MKIGVDLGHGVGQDRGATGIINEETIINEVGEKVINKLQELGHEVIRLRPTQASSVNDSLIQRYNKANINNVDLCVSIHANAGGGQGTEVFTYNAKPIQQATNILSNMEKLGFKNRGIKNGNGLAMVRRPSATAMLIEVCFVDTSTDVENYKKVGSESIANAIVEGITGTSVTSEDKYYVVTNYLPSAYEGYNGIDINYVLSYFSDVKTYVKGDSNGVWIETQYLSLAECNRLKNTLGSWYYDTRK